MRGCFDSVNFPVKGQGPQERIKDRDTITLRRKDHHEPKKKEKRTKGEEGKKQ